MIPSPYTPGTTPSVLAGRQAQINDAQRDLAATATFGHFGGRIRVNTGPRGVGKTSLLKAVRDDADRAGFVTGWVTARTDESLIIQIVGSLRRGLDAIGISTDTDPGFRDRLRSLTLELGAGPAKAGVELDVAPTPPIAAAAATTFAELITTWSIAARKRGSAGLCLIIDEVQTAPVQDIRTIAYAWQEMQGQVPEPPALLFTAGLPNTPDVLTDAVTFSERFAFRTLERLNSHDAADALTGPAEQHQVEWDAQLIQHVVDQAQGYPYFLQLYGDAVWNTVQPETGGVLPTSAFHPAEVMVRAELDTMFRARWSKASPAEQRLLTAMAHFGDEPVKRAALAERLNLTSNDLSIPRRDLIDKGLIEAVGRGNLRFTTPGFAEFISAETGQESR